MLKSILATVFIAAVILSVGTSAEAGFADDWLANSTTSSPSYFEGQKRGYLSAGGFNARWKTSSDYLVSVTPPRIKAGCGGIDAFWGGVSFLNPDYLVQKLEQIVQNAPAVALDLALNVMCEPCKNAMETMENATNKLNQLQLDDCKASKAIVATTAQALGSDKEELNTIVTDFEVSTGVKDFYTSSQKGFKTNGGTPNPDSVKGAVADCSAEIKSIFVTPAETNGKSSILSNIAARLSMPSSYAQLLAGMVGDIGIDFDSTSGFTTHDIPFCEENRKLNVDGLLSDKPYLRDFNDPNGQCSQATDVNANVKLYVDTKLASISSKMQSMTALTSDEENFLNYSSGVGYEALKVGVETDTVDAVQDVIANITAKDITRHMLNDLYTKGEAMLNKAAEIAKKNEDSTSGVPQKCQLKLFQGAFDKVKDMKSRIAVLRRELDSGYQKDLEQMNVLTSYIRDRQDAAKRFEAEVGNRFGMSVMSRGGKI